MKIIRLGNMDLQFCCPYCRTIFEISTQELKEEKDNWKTKCPLCDEEIKFTPEDSVRKFLTRRKELEQK